jgi:NAD(P)H-flavin reductase
VHNLYHPEPAKIVKITPQTDTISLFRFEFEQKVWGYDFSFKPGQFIELSIPGYGEAPFAPCNAPGTKYLELCIRDAGRLTHKLHEMKIGERVGIRGQYGNGWPIENSQIPITNSQNEKQNIKNLLIIIGGLGLVPLRSLIFGKDKFLGKDAKIQIFYGARLPQEMLFRYEYNNWRSNGVEVRLTIDNKCLDWVGCVGLVTTLFDQYPLVENAKAFLCGPPVMYKSTLTKLKEKGIPDENIFLSLERRMHCGLGVCQHCAVGPYYTCKDGPVFAYDKIKNIPGAI